MEHEVRQSMSMAQLLQPNTATQPAESPEIHLVYTKSNSYMEDFNILENKILQDVGDTDTEKEKRELKKRQS